MLPTGNCIKLKPNSPRCLPGTRLSCACSTDAAAPSGGVAPGADCEDQGLRNVCYAFVDNEGTNSQANVASQEIGHTMGLGHTYGDDRVMAFGYDAFSGIDPKDIEIARQVLARVRENSGRCTQIDRASNQ